MTSLQSKEVDMYPEICIVENHAIKGHAVGRLLDASELQKRIVLALQFSTFALRKEGRSQPWNHRIPRTWLS